LSQQKTLNFRVTQENVVTDPTFFSKFRLWGPTLTQNFANFKSKFQSCNLQLITFLKRYLASKSTNKWLRYRQNKDESRLFLVQNHDFIQFLHVFQPSFGDNSAICWSIFMHDTVLERLLVVDYMTEILILNLQTFVLKLVPEVEICWKKWDLWPHFLE
jgi:hypothetical protein